MPSWESTEWTRIGWSDPQNNKRILLIGDSITNGYFQYVAREFESEYSVGYHVSSKAIDNIYLFKEIENTVNEFGRDTVKVVHINNGIHGVWHLKEDAVRVCYEHFIISLREILPDARVIIATSTPIRKAGDDKEYVYDKFNANLVRNNAIIAEIGHKYGITVEDLYAVADGKCEYGCGDGVHFNDAGYRALAETVKKSIRDELTK